MTLRRNPPVVRAVPALTQPHDTWQPWTYQGQEGFSVAAGMTSMWVCDRTRSCSLSTTTDVCRHRHPAPPFSPQVPQPASPEAPFVSPSPFPSRHPLGPARTSSYEAGTKRQTATQLAARSATAVARPITTSTTTTMPLRHSSAAARLGHRRGRDSSDVLSLTGM